MQWEKEEGRKVSECVALAIHRENHLNVPEAGEQEHKRCRKHGAVPGEREECQEAPRVQAARWVIPFCSWLVFRVGYGEGMKDGGGTWVVREYMGTGG